MRVAVVLLFAACGFQPTAAPDAITRLDGPLVLDGPVSDNHVFTTDSSTLAIFELNGDVTDSSGNGFDATLIGGTFVATSWGQGLSVPGGAVQGFEWTAHANLIAHPFTIEMVLTPVDVSCWRKLFGPDDALDIGWNYCMKFQTCCGDATVGPDLPAAQRHYLAIVSTSTTQDDVYINGTLAGSIHSGFTAPPSQAIFFRDDSQTSRMEALTGVIDAVRISGVARTPTEIAAIQTRLATRP